MLWKRTLASLYAVNGRYEDGVRLCAVAVGPANTCRLTLAALAGTPALKEQGLARVGVMNDLPRAMRSPMWTAMVYAREGMADSMFSRLSSAIASHDDSFAHLITSRDFAKYQSDPRWDAIVGAVQRR